MTDIAKAFPDTINGITDLAEKIAEAGELMIEWASNCPQTRGPFKKIIHAKYYAAMQLIPVIGSAMAPFVAGPVAGISVDLMGCGTQDDHIYDIMDSVTKGRIPNLGKTVDFVFTAVSDMKGGGFSKSQQKKYMKLMLKNVAKQAVKDIMPIALKNLVEGMENLVGMEECEFSCDPVAVKAQQRQEDSRNLDFAVNRHVRVKHTSGKYLYVKDSWTNTNGQPVLYIDYQNYVGTRWWLAKKQIHGSTYYMLETRDYMTCLDNGHGNSYARYSIRPCNQWNDNQIFKITKARSDPHSSADQFILQFRSSENKQTYMGYSGGCYFDSPGSCYYVANEKGHYSDDNYMVKFELV